MRLGLIEVRAALTAGGWMRAYPRRMRLGLIEVSVFPAYAGIVIRGIRGACASASLQRATDEGGFVRGSS